MNRCGSSSGSANGQKFSTKENIIIRRKEVKQKCIRSKRVVSSDKDEHISRMWLLYFKWYF
jgi:hypothetical protein